MYRTHCAMTATLHQIVYTTVASTQSSLPSTSSYLSSSHSSYSSTSSSPSSWNISRCDNSSQSSPLSWHSFCVFVFLFLCVLSVRVWRTDRRPVLDQLRRKLDTLDTCWAEVMTTLLNKHYAYNGHYRVTEEDGDQRITQWKKVSRVEKDMRKICGEYVLTAEDWGGSTIQSWMETNGLWSYWQWQRQEISYLKLSVTWLTTYGLPPTRTARVVLF